MAMQIIMKICSKCKNIKQLSEFHKNRAKKDGYQDYCKICQRNVVKKYQKTDKGRDNHNASCLKYFKSEKGKANLKRYRSSKKGKATYKRYSQSEKGKDNARRYRESEKGKISAIKSTRKQRIFYPQKIKAVNAVNNAIRKRQLPPPDSLQCSCGNPAKDYHHHKGYEPKHYLDVVPVCKKCHSVIHNS